MKNELILDPKKMNRMDDFFLIVAFDTTFSKNIVMSYDEGIVFARQLMELIEEFKDCFIIFKEKKDRKMHKVLDPVLGPQLVDIYNQMNENKRIGFCDNNFDASALINFADMVISLPFTSTTFEALSMNKPAIWHDPAGYYRNTLYGKAGGVTTHSYDELKVKVMEIKDMKAGAYQNPLPVNSPLMDPYRDGKAIDRFRKLLTSQ
jgi:polysaccharide biosynthesis PFTS motif protein